MVGPDFTTCTSTTTNGSFYRLPYQLQRPSCTGNRAGPIFVWMPCPGFTCENGDVRKVRRSSKLPLIVLSDKFAGSSLVQATGACFRAQSPLASARRSHADRKFSYHVSVKLVMTCSAVSPAIFTPE